MYLLHDFACVCQLGVDTNYQVRMNRGDTWAGGSRNNTLTLQARISQVLRKRNNYSGSIFGVHKYYHMNEIGQKLKELFQRIPRRHTADNVKEIYSILDTYEDLLKTMEADERYEKQIGRFFESLEPIRATIKKSNDGKASKKAKDVLFDEASGALKDMVEETMQL